ncbi:MULTISPECIES: Crp/Fnr family transcriptional regulator [unclassified Saccharopolyspora]|uniref:Crp/Fnr family transcriptional regulator n=1 Tax=unclassified Saccharopolyspora TaxID=2646250 RepID=UPI001CD19949|nr:MULTISPECIES: Crp/Fnr family transcriptional regulator [unclassified Saccharopolyspora]MCA1184975.1 Crp/Fnr family transcriptional regulator [Saccharopolyspora sp. 6T]MCA1190697.1 Crp/Fnr family transcriptional regulator [Saccharopolyspora sp. 6V]MCA1278161.1 Crp/Fnr family transcriptional regulator [Saccharopolyspora sp. 7B]
MHHDANHLPAGFRALLGDRRWAALVGSGVRRNHRAGEYLLRQNDRGGHLFALISGRVKVLAGLDGSQVLLSLRGAGDLVGEMAARGNSRRMASVQALDACTSCVLKRAEFDRFLHDHGAHGLLSDYLVGKLSETVPYQVQQFHFGPLQRVARLCFEVHSLADARQPDRARIPFSQEALAQALGMARSTVAEQIAVLRSSGALGPGPRLVVDDEHALAAQAGAVPPS